MKLLTIRTLAIVIVLALSVNPSVAGTDLYGQPVSSAVDRDTDSVTPEASMPPLYALSRLEAQNLAEQELTDQELKEVEGGLVVIVIIAILLAPVYHY